MLGERGADPKVTPTIPPPPPLAVPSLQVPVLRPEPGHIPALDGIRGIAILLVILHHSLHGWGPAQSGLEGALRGVLSHSWAGVDLFFVLSGFLITGILLDTRGRKGYFSSFYPRRMLRTFPLYYATIAVCFLILPLFGIYEQLSSRQGWFWLHASNLYNILHNIVRVDGPPVGWMSTFWSLAVEEHFYLVWPLVVCGCSPKRVVRVSLALVTAGLALRIGLAARGCDFQVVYNNTFTRLDGMLFGSAVAAMSRTEGGLAARLRGFHVLLAVSLAGLVAMRLFGGPFFNKTFLFTAIAAAFASLMVMVLQSPPRSLARAFLSTKLLQACGKHSYAMYILNIPMFLLIDTLFAPRSFLGILAYTVLGTAMSLGGAWVSWHLLEKHCLKLKRFFVTSPSPSADPPSGAVRCA